MRDTFVQGLRQKEAERHHAVMHCDKVAEMHQTTRTQAQVRHHVQWSEFHMPIFGEGQ